MSALVSRIRALESSAKASKAFELKAVELAFANNELKAQVQDLRAQVERMSSTNMSLEAK